MADTVQPSAPLPWWVIPGFAYTILVAFIVIAMRIVWTSADVSQYTQYVIAAAIALASTTMGYYFHSSAGSEKKSDVIASDSANKSAALAISAPAAATAEPSEAASEAAKAIDLKLAAAHA